MKLFTMVGAVVLTIAGCSGLWVVFNFLAQTPEAGVR